MVKVTAMGMRFGLVVIGVALAGCKGSQPVAASAAGSDVRAAADGASATAVASGGTQVQYINDPSLNMNAIAVTIPAKWKFQGIFMQPGNCVPTPFGVFRATSPDGASMAEVMPTLAWQWGQGPFLSYLPKNDCLPMNGPMSAQDFLKYMAMTMKVHYDGDAPVPAAEQAKSDKALATAQATYAPKYAAAHLQMPKQTADLARAWVSYTRGGIPMKGLLDVNVGCMETQYAGMPGLSPWSPGHPVQKTTGAPSTVDKCTAAVMYCTAPAGQIEAVVRAWDAPGMGTKAQDDWLQAWIHRSDVQTEEAINKINRDGQMQRQAMAQQFQHSMAVQQQMHDQFMQGMQQNFDHYQAGVAANWAARDASTSDWVDFALDRQTVRDNTTGAIYKVTNQVTPEQPLEQVHGDGTPIHLALRGRRCFRLDSRGRVQATVCDGFDRS